MRKDMWAFFIGWMRTRRLEGNFSGRGETFGSFVDQEAVFFFSREMVRLGCILGERAMTFALF